MKAKWKNAVVVLLIVVFVGAIVAGVTVSVLEENRRTTEIDYYIDDLSISYDTDENVIYTKRFRDTIEGLLSFYSETRLVTLADRIISAASEARIPAKKLAAAATAIKEIDLATWGESVLDYSEEKLREKLQQTTSSVVKNAICAFFNKSELTTREFAAFLYEYLNQNGTDDYKTALALSAIGKETFIDLIGSTCFLVVESARVGSGRMQNGRTFLVACNEYGEMLKEAYLIGGEHISTILGFGLDRFPEEVNAMLDYVNEKTPYVFALLGYLFADIGSATAENYAENKFDKTDYSVYETLAKDVYRGMEKYLSDCGEDIGARDYDELSAAVVRYMDDLHRAHYVAMTVDVENEEMQDYLNEYRQSCVKFFAALRDLAVGGEYTAEQKTAQIQDFTAFSGELDAFFEGFLYLWVMQRLGEVS